jgi:integrase/recombinase XerD
MKHIERLKKMVLAAKMEWIPKDPFGRFQLKFHKTERDFLTKEELAIVETYSFTEAKLERARDMFVFACYSGLSYIDLVNLTASNIIIGIDGEYWIRTSRQKTEISVNIPLLDPAKKVIDKYKNDPVVSNKGGLLPYLCNQKVNEYLKKIALICGIEKHLSFHLARHTFSTTVTLANGVPLETVSKMLGHTKLTTTQIYVHVLQKKVSDDMSHLRQKLIKPDVESKHYNPDNPNRDQILLLSKDSTHAFYCDMAD